VLTEIQNAVTKGDKVSITGFGVFEKRVRAARTARNPRTGESVKVKKTSVPAFRPGASFKDLVAAGRVQKATKAAAAPAKKATAAKKAAPAKAVKATTVRKAAPAKERLPFSSLWIERRAACHISMPTPSHCQASIFLLPSRSSRSASGRRTVAVIPHCAGHLRGYQPLRLPPS